MSLYERKIVSTTNIRPVIDVPCLNCETSIPVFVSGLTESLIHEKRSGGEEQTIPIINGEPIATTTQKFAKCPKTGGPHSVNIA